MRISHATLLLVLSASLCGGCGSDVDLDEITIEICPSILGTTSGVDLIIARPEGFGMPLPPGTRLEDFDGQSPDELVWQVPEPSGGWREFNAVHLDHLTGSETLTARVSHGAAQSASATLLVTSGLRLPVCQAGADGGVADAGLADAGVADADSDAGSDSDAGILQNVQIATVGTGDSITPSMVSTGTELAVAWVDNRDGNDEIYFARLTGTGSLIGSEVRVTTDAGRSSGPWLIWTGVEYAVAWFDNRDGNDEIYFRRIDTDGTLLGASPVRVTNDAASSLFPSLVYNDSGYAIAWEDKRNGEYQIYITVLNATGGDILDDTRLTTTDIEAVAASLVWNGVGYALAWHDKRHNSDEEIYFAEVDTDGAVVGLERRITDSPGRSSIPRLVWTGSGYGMVWEDSRDGASNTYFLRLSSTGVKIGSESPVDAFNAPQLLPNITWTGASYALAWSDIRFGNSEIMFASFNGAGAVIGAPARVTTATGSSGSPSLAELAGAIKIIWHDARLGANKLFFQASAP